MVTFGVWGDRAFDDFPPSAARENCIKWTQKPGFLANLRRLTKYFVKNPVSLSECVNPD